MDENPHPALKGHPLPMLGEGTTKLFAPLSQHWEKGRGCGRLLRERPILDVPPDVLVRSWQDALELFVDAEDLVVRPPEERRHILVQDRGGFMIDLGPRRDVRGAASLNEELIEIGI